MLDYHSLGFVDNPFEASVGAPATSSWWARFLVHRATNRLWSEAERNSAAERPQSIWVSYPEEVPIYYVRASENEFLARTADEKTLDALAVNIPLKRMHVGRTRSALTELAELVAAVDFDLTLGRYAVEVFSAPDEHLPEFAELDGIDIGEVHRALEESPASTITDWATVHRAGPDASDVAERDAVHHVVVEQMMQESDPEETDLTAESDSEPDAEATVADSDVEEAAEEEAAASRLVEDRLIDYLVAHARAHLSPVVGRGIRAYFEHGADTLAQGLRVTKAPRKTLAAVVRLAGYQWRQVIMIYDSFDLWELIDEDQRPIIVGTFVEMRLSLGASGTLAFLVEEGKAVELEDQFAGARRVRWDMNGMDRLQTGEKFMDLALIQEALDAAAVDEEGSPIRADGPELAPLVEAAPDDIEAFVRMAGEAFRHAAGRGCSSVDDEAIQAGLARTSWELRS